MSLGIQHVNATDPNIHEPKGASTAASGSVYVSDGAGSGTWRRHDYSLTISIDDASTAGPTSYWITVPFQSNLIKAYAIVNDTFSMDQTIDFEIAGIAVTGGTINLLTSGSAAGSIYLCTPTATRTVNAGASLEIINTGGSASPFSVTLTLVFSPL